MALDKALLMEMLRRMVCIRLFEEEVIRMVDGRVPRGRDSGMPSGMKDHRA